MNKAFFSNSEFSFLLPGYKGISSSVRTKDADLVCIKSPKDSLDVLGVCLRESLLDLALNLVLESRKVKYNDFYFLCFIYFQCAMPNKVLYSLNYTETLLKSCVTLF